MLYRTPFAYHKISNTSLRQYYTWEKTFTQKSRSVLHDVPLNYDMTCDRKQLLAKVNRYYIITRIDLCELL